MVVAVVVVVVVGGGRGEEREVVRVGERRRWRHPDVWGTSGICRGGVGG